jgi:hypothetical protein
MSLITSSSFILREGHINHSTFRMDSAYKSAWTIFFQNLLVFVNYQKLRKQVLCNSYMKSGEVHDLVQGSDYGSNELIWIHPG